MLIHDFLFGKIEQFLKLNPKILNALHRIKIFSMRDLLFYIPNYVEHKYIGANLSHLKDGMLIQADIQINDIQIPAKKNQPIQILASNQTGHIKLVFFNRIPEFIFKNLKIGSLHTVIGKVQKFDHRFQIAHPEFIVNPRIKSLHVESSYSLTYNLSNRQLYSYILQGLELFEKQITSLRDAQIKTFCSNILHNLKILHLDLDPHKKEIAKKILAQHEFFANQTYLKIIREQNHKVKGRTFVSNTSYTKVLDNLGFELTQFQESAIKEIQQQQSSEMQMMHLLQGDVGSGKTLVALITILNVAQCGVQSAFMAPTDLLAHQHYHFFQQALSGLDIKIEIITGKTTSKARKTILANLQNGTIDIIIGTHALFQNNVEFKDLGYVVIDEQHKFGVTQRLSLLAKANQPDLLVMTATPIPRSLMLTMFGDMTVSILAGKPKNRIDIITTVVPDNKLNAVILSLNKKILAKEKVYWVCPLIESGEEMTTPTSIDVASRYNSLNEIYPSKVLILHGKMSTQEKDSVMNHFKNGDANILVATTVVEVGVDVSDATLMIIENAEKFGLAQLHQLRGRVGRGNKQSYCILIYYPKYTSNLAKKRLAIIKNTTDGFIIAEQDLLHRGSGDLLGVKQSGEPTFFFANLQDQNLLENARLGAEAQNESSLASEITALQIKMFSPQH